LGPDNIGCLEPFWALQQIKLHRFAFVECAIPILLDGGEMNEDILACGTLNKTVTFRSVKPLHCALLSHKATPFASAVELKILRPASFVVQSPTCRYKAGQKLLRMMSCESETAVTQKKPRSLH